MSINVNCESICISQKESMVGHDKLCVMQICLDMVRGKAIDLCKVDPEKNRKQMKKLESKRERFWQHLQPTQVVVPSSVDESLETTPLLSKSQSHWCRTDMEVTMLTQDEMDDMEQAMATRPPMTDTSGMPML